MKEKMENIEQQIMERAELKRDACMNLLSLTPEVSSGRTSLVSKRGKGHDLIHNGLRSYLDKLEVHGGMYKKCDDENKRGLLRQFHPQNGKKDVLVRMLGDDIRFIGSQKYNCFDDTDILQALQQTDIFDKLDIATFIQDPYHTVLRAVGKEPLPIAGMRPFYAGLQLINSEVGNSAVKLAFFIWEQVCSNGQVVAHGNFPQFNMIHSGKKNHDRLSSALARKLESMDDFMKNCVDSINILKETPSTATLDRIQRNTEIPVAVKTTFTDYLENYTDKKIEDASSLDVLSALTESAQKYHWDTRYAVERAAGNIAFSTTGD